MVSELTGATLAALDEAKTFYDCAHFYATRTDLLIPNSNGWWRYEQRSITTARPSYKSANYSCVMSVVPFFRRAPPCTSSLKEARCPCGCRTLEVGSPEKNQAMLFKILMIDFARSSIRAIKFGQKARKEFNVAFKMFCVLCCSFSL